jgi:hypothetical protein
MRGGGLNPWSSWSVSKKSAAGWTKWSVWKKRRGGDASGDVEVVHPSKYSLQVEFGVGFLEPTPVLYSSSLPTNGSPKEGTQGGDGEDSEKLLQ